MDDTALTSKAFARRLSACISFVAPLGYVAYIASVAIHELVGHGCTAWLLGGQFTGFALMPDGMGWADGWSPEHENVLLAGGVISGIVFGAMFLVAAVTVAHPLWRVSLLLFSICCFEDAAPYAFWNSLFPRPPGDFGRILLDLNSESVRWTLIVVFGTIYVGATVWLNVLIFRCFESILGCLGKRRAILIAWLLFGLGGGLSWFAFDWNQLIEGVGRLPQYTGASLQLSVAPLLVWIRQRDVECVDISRTFWTYSIVAAWLVCIGLVVTLAVWLRHGVSWA